MTKEEDTRNIPIRIPTSLLEAMDRLIEKGRFKSRSDFMAYAIRQYIEGILETKIYETKVWDSEKEQ